MASQHVRLVGVVVRHSPTRQHTSNIYKELPGWVFDLKTRSENIFSECRHSFSQVAWINKDRG